MQKSKGLDRGTTIYNLYELCGILINAGKLAVGRALFEEYATSKGIEILYPKIALRSERRFWAVHNDEIMKRIERDMRVGDAAILWALECKAFCWKDHYQRSNAGGVAKGTQRGLAT